MLQKLWLAQLLRQDTGNKGHVPASVYKSWATGRARLGRASKLKN
jgi:hypothetical protein